MLEIQPYKPVGVEKAFNILSKSMGNKDTKYLVYYDPDVDGLFAGYIAQSLLTKFNRKSEYHINNNREHGFLMSDEQLEKYKGYTVLAVDFSMTRERLQEVVDKGINVISIDHHEIDEEELVYYENKEGYQGIILNNQYPFEPIEHQYLSGAGMVYYFVQFVYDVLKLGEVEKDYSSLVGITLLSDVRPLENNKAQAFLQRTYTNDSELMQYLIDITKGKYLSSISEKKYGSFGRIKTMYRNYIDFTFSPKFNALFRLNMGLDAIKLINQEEGMREKYEKNFLLDVLKDKQNTIRDAIIENLEGKEYSHLIVKYVPADFIIEEKVDMVNFIGVACSRVNNNKKTTFLYQEKSKGVVEKGSVRGLLDNLDYLTIFEESNIPSAGHKAAFGVLNTDISGVNWEEINEKIKIAETKAKEKKEDSSENILEVEDLSKFLVGKNKKIPEYNAYVRNQFRKYIKYTGKNYTRKKIGKLIEYTIDGIKVKSFEEEQNLENSHILAIIEKAGYVEYTLKRL